jgi:hypothetical protein
MSTTKVMGTVLALVTAETRIDAKSAFRFSIDLVTMGFWEVQSGCCHHLHFSGNGAAVNRKLDEASGTPD